MIKSPLDHPIAQQHYIWVRPDGSEVAVTAKLGTPYLEEATTWRCPAALEGVDQQYPDIFGEGSMQALGLAIRLIRSRLLATIEDQPSPFTALPPAAHHPERDPEWLSEGAEIAAVAGR